MREYTSAMKKMNEKPNIVIDGFEISKEFEYFEATSNRSEKLKKLYRALLITKATRVQSERAFSITGLFNTKTRMSLSEVSQNAGINMSMSTFYQCDFSLQHLVYWLE
ncbi:XP_014779685.1PREDICTED: uncharacterized protein LOC106875891 [Octopus vulgaris]|uniref:XP_014779685.1PREDICTED: uncharacterized protein LOC106875891 n=1 Tax=Octopus vulgaris TaxID=6645 RepID=A0AA36AX82_OCTVU|nr:XP_014779685.1PREDICTED: uncharacterized protein LOC106875891 [Octopus vulgaris]